MRITTHLTEEGIHFVAGSSISKPTFSFLIHYKVREQIV